MSFSIEKTSFGTFFFVLGRDARWGRVLSNVRQAAAPLEFLVDPVALFLRSMGMKPLVGRGGIDPQHGRIALGGEKSHMYRPIIYGSACCLSLCIASVALAVCAASGSGSIPASPRLVLASILVMGFSLIAAQLLALRMIEASRPCRRRAASGRTGSQEQRRGASDNPFLGRVK